MESKDYEIILDSLQMTGIYVIREDNHQILYFNKRVKEVAPNIKIGMICHELWAGSCSNCPLLDIGDKKESRSINYDDPFGKAVDIVATRILWEETIPAFSIAVTPHADAVSYIYSKILKVNLTTDSYEIFQMRQGERKHSMLNYFKLSKWFAELVEKGKIYQNDVERFQKFTKIEHLKEEFCSSKKMAVCTYRYRTEEGFRWHTMEIVPDFNYSDESQSAMLYVKDVHDIYRKGLELEEINIQNQEIIKSLGELNFGIYVVDLSTGVLNPIRVSEEMKEIIPAGIQEWDDIFTKMLDRYFHPDCREKLWDAYSLKALRNVRKRQEIICQCMLHGTYRYVSATAYFYENNAESQYVVLALQDVDECTRQEIRRNQNDKRMAAIIKSRYYIMYSVNLDTGICEVDYINETDSSNKKQVGDFEYCIQKAADEAVHEEYAEKFRNLFTMENLRRKAAEVEEFEEIVFQFRCKGPAVKWLEDHLFFIRQDKGVMVNILGRNITGEKLKEVIEIREKRERNHIINSMSSLFFASYYLDMETDSYQIVTQKDEVGNALKSELSCTEAFQTYARCFVHPDDREEYLKKMNCEHIRNTLSWEHPFWAIEYRRIEEKAGRITDNGWIRATVVLSEMKDGKPGKVLYVAQDVTESKEKEEREHRALKEACDAAIHANASKSEFLSRMSHDIRTPMNAIIGMTAIAGTHLDDRERVSDCLNKITISSKHLLALINEVLDMSKIESGKIDLAEEEFNLSDLVQNLLTMIRPAVQAKNHELTLHIGKIDHEDVIGDAMRLQQVFMNILGNAVKYTPAGGNLELEIAEKMSKTYGYGCYEFIFKDNGIGMSEEFLNRIFEPFSRAEDSRVSKIEGTGLGMTIALNIVQMMNGSIHIESKEGEGSKFTVTVFLKQQSTTDAGMERFIDLPVLVVDDDRYDCEAACAVLNDIGMKSEWVLSGRDAVKRVCEAGERGEDFFAIILDWKMPDMDGIQTAKAIRKKVGPDVTIIILSAYDWSDVEAEARQAGVDGFISKPMFKSRLIYLLKKITEEENKEEITENEAVSGQDFRGRRILLAEDNELNREIAEEIIQSTGAIVESVVNGEQALKRFCEKDEWYYDLIFMDIQMPVMNGHEAAKAIRKLNRRDAKEIPILAMTADAFAEDVIASRRAGMNEHIMKPLNVEQLMESMKRWLSAGKLMK